MKVPYKSMEYPIKEIQKWCLHKNNASKGDNQMWLK